MVISLYLFSSSHPKSQLFHLCKHNLNIKKLSIIILKSMLDNYGSFLSVLFFLLSTYDLSLSGGKQKKEIIWGTCMTLSYSRKDLCLLLESARLDTSPVQSEYDWTLVLLRTVYF